MTTDQLQLARADAVNEIVCGFFKVSLEALARHGDDPHVQAILGTALAMFIEKVDEGAYPGFKRHLTTLFARTSV